MEGEKNPSEVVASYERGELSRDAAISLLITVIENDNRRRVRVESLQLLRKIAKKDGKFIEYLEEIVISDVDEVVRSASVRILVERFPDESMDILKWVLKNEMSMNCVEEILEGLSLRDADYLTLILRNLFKTHLEEKENQLDNIRHFFSELERLLSRIPLNQIPLAELREMYLDYKVLVNLEQKYHLSQDYIDCFSWGGYITKLDLSGQNIRSISEIEGWLARLTRLEVLDLKANKITEITGLEHCKSLEILKLQWNQVDKIEGLDLLTNLSSINLAENQIIEIQGLQNLISLSRLELGSNKISRISGLETLRILSRIFINFEINSSKLEESY